MRWLIADTRTQTSGVSPEDLHQTELIQSLALSAPGAELSLVASDGLLDEHPEEAVIRPRKLTGRQALTFVQKQLPGIASSIDAQAILCLFGGAPLRSTVPVFSYQFSTRRSNKASVIDRLALAAAQAGANALATRVRIADLPSSSSAIEEDILLDPWVADAFSPSQGAGDRSVLAALGLTPGYVLAFGFSRDELAVLIAAWSWVVRATGESNPLVLIGVEREGLAHIQSHAQELELESTILIRESPGLDQLPGLYRQASLSLHGAARQIGQAVRWGLSCGIPVVAMESPSNASIVGDAAYLTPPGDARALGGAILSILVQDDFAESLRERGMVRAEHYRREAPLKPLIDALSAAES